MKKIELLQKFKETVLQKFNKDKALNAVKYLYQVAKLPLPRDIVIIDSVGLNDYTDPIVEKMKRSKSTINLGLTSLLRGDKDYDKNEYLFNNNSQLIHIFNNDMNYSEILDEAIDNDDSKMIDAMVPEVWLNAPPFNTGNLFSRMSLPFNLTLDAKFGSFYRNEMCKLGKIRNIFESDDKINLKIMDGGIHSLHLTRDYCVILKNPTIFKTKNGQVHSDNGPAVKFGKTEFYAYDGEFIPKNWITNKRSITKEVVNRTINQEHQAILIKILGVDGYFKKRGSGRMHMINNTVDNQGNPMKLHEVGIGSNDVKVLECVCPSTKHTYFIAPLDQGTTDVWEAKGSTFGISGEQCKKMLIET